MEARAELTPRLSSSFEKMQPLFAYLLGENLKDLLLFGGPVAGDASIKSKFPAVLEGLRRYSLPPEPEA